MIENMTESFISNIPLKTRLFYTILFYNQQVEEEEVLVDQSCLRN
jgi:hypothetical protein